MPFVTASPLITAAPGPSLSRGPVPSVRAQALEGAKVFAAHCATCHGTQLEGGAGPALVGPDFVAEISQDRLSLGDVFGMVAYQMPYDAPGSLSHADYEDIVAFLMARNGRTLMGPGLVYDTALKSTAPFLSPAP
jgi:polar amino acid transport system substrate-binding protein